MHRPECQGFQAAIGHVLQILARVPVAHAHHPLGQDILGERRLAIDGFPDHRHDVRFHGLVKKIRLLPTYRRDHAKGKRDVRALITENPVRPGRQAME